MSDKKAISESTRLQALGLFTMMAHHSSKLAEFERELGRLLGYDIDDTYLGHLSDRAMGGDSNDKSPDGFDVALKLEGFVVEPHPSKKAG